MAAAWYGRGLQQIYMMSGVDTISKDLEEKIQEAPDVTRFASGRSFGSASVPTAEYFASGPLLTVTICETMVR